MHKGSANQSAHAMLLQDLDPENYVSTLGECQ